MKHPIKNCLLNGLKYKLFTTSYSNYNYFYFRDLKKILICEYFWWKKKQWWIQLKRRRSTLKEVLLIFWSGLGKAATVANKSKPTAPHPTCTNTIKVTFLSFKDEKGVIESKRELTTMKFSWRDSPDIVFTQTQSNLKNVIVRKFLVA